MKGNYLQGLRAGVAARGMQRREMARLLEAAVGGGEDGTTTKTGDLNEGRFDLFAKLAECAAADRAPDAGERVLLESHGFTYLGPDEDGFVVRMYPAEELLTAAVLRALAALCQNFGNGSVQLEGRYYLVLRNVDILEAPEVLRRIEAAGWQTAGGREDPVKGASVGGTDQVAGPELCVPSGRLCSGQMLSLAALLEEDEFIVLRLNAARGLTFLAGENQEFDLEKFLRIIHG